MESLEHPVRDGLIALVAHSREDHQRFFAEASDSEKAAYGEPETWSLRDHYNHNNFWRERLLAIFRMAQTGELPTPITDFEVQNQQIFQERQALSWETINAEADRLISEIMATLATFSEDDLNEPVQIKGAASNTPLRPRVIHFAYEHPLSHYVQLYRERGEIDRALAQQQTGTDIIGRLLGKGTDYGDMLYNQACAFMKLAMPQEAIAALRESFIYAPENREGLRDDPDLVDLHDLPAFQSL